MASCIFRPTVTNSRGETVDSKLFDDLDNFYSDRDTAVTIYSFTQTSIFKELFLDSGRLELDENGEPTIESLKKELHLVKTLSKDRKLEELSKKLGAIDSNGKQVVYKRSADLVRKAIAFNESQPEFIASVQQTDNGFVLRVVRADINTIVLRDQLVKNSALNNRLIAILNSYGFNFVLDNTIMDEGLFSPIRADETLEGILNIIRLSEGERGVNAFTEEMSHFLVEGLRETPMVKRLLKQLGVHDAYKQILGEEYDKYYEKYDGDRTALIHEAAAKLLTDSFGGSLENLRNAGKTNVTFRQRIRGYILHFFRREANVFKNLKEQADKIAADVYFGPSVEKISKEKVMTAREYSQVEKDNNFLKSKLEEGIKLKTKELDIAKSKLLRFEKSQELQEQTIELSHIKDNIAKYEEKLNSDFLIKGLCDLESMIVESIKDLEIRIQQAMSNPMITVDEINEAARLMQDLEEYRNSYGRYIKELAAMDEQTARELGVTYSDLKMVAADANIIKSALSRLKIKTKEVRYSIVKAFFKNTLGIDADTELFRMKDSKNIEHVFTLDGLLHFGERDIDGFDRWFSALSDTSDPMLGLFDAVVKRLLEERDRAMSDEYVPRINAIDAALKRSGIRDTGHIMYEEYEYEDEKGKKHTALYVRSNIDWDKFYKAKKKAYDKIDADKSLSKAQKTREKLKWMYLNTEDRDDDQVIPLLYRTKEVNGVEVKEELYIKPEGQRLEDVLNEAELKYYNDMMQLKEEMEQKVPMTLRQTYRPIYLRSDLVEKVTSGRTGKGFWREVMNNIKDTFVYRADDDGFGNPIQIVSTSLDGKVRKTIPLLYMQKLPDPSHVTRDFTTAMKAYTATVSNYSVLSRAIDVLELTKSLMQERKIKKTTGLIQSITKTRMVGSKSENEAVVMDSLEGQTKFFNRLNDYFDTVIYGIRKKDEGVIFGNISVAKTADAFKNYVTIAGLGLNLFSGVSNVIMGKFQMFLEFCANEWMTRKDILVAKKRYWSLVWDYLAEINSPNKISTMSLMVDKFDALDDYFYRIKERGYYNSVLGRIVGNSSTLFMQTAGEHYLHVHTMFAVLNNEKVKYIDEAGNEKTATLFDAFTKQEITDDDGNVLSARLVLKPGYVRENGLPITDDYIFKVKRKIKGINNQLHGNFNADDTAALNKYAVGRLVLQFRRWMITYYQRRYAGKRHNFLLDQDIEGFYRTFLRISINAAKEIFKGKFVLSTFKNSLDKHEKANYIRALVELGTFIGLGFLLTVGGGYQDHKGKWLTRMLYLTGMRLRTEIGAGTLSFSTINNFLTILQSPAAAIAHFNNVMNMFNVFDIFREVESGRYAGMSVYWKNMITKAPLIGSIRRITDLSNEDYMFTALAGIKWNKRN